MRGGRYLAMAMYSLAALGLWLALPGQSSAGSADRHPGALPPQSAKAPAVVEVPARGAHGTVTIFYSGDGGWRDLDKSVAEEMAKQGHPVIGIDCLRTFWSRRTPEQATESLAWVMDYYRRTWGAKRFVLAGYSFGADILPPIYNRLSQNDRDSIALLVLLAFSREADFEIHLQGFIGKKSQGIPLAPELARLPSAKLFCVYGKEEKNDSGCTDLAGTQAEILELPGGHHFDEDYPKLTGLILDRYRRSGLAAQP